MSQVPHGVLSDKSGRRDGGGGGPQGDSVALGSSLREPGRLPLPAPGLSPPFSPPSPSPFAPHPPAPLPTPHSRFLGQSGQRQAKDRRGRANPASNCPPVPLTQSPALACLLASPLNTSERLRTIFLASKRALRQAPHVTFSCPRTVAAIPYRNLEEQAGLTEILLLATSFSVTPRRQDRPQTRPVPVPTSAWGRLGPAHGEAEGRTPFGSNGGGVTRGGPAGRRPRPLATPPGSSPPRSWQGVVG